MSSVSPPWWSSVLGKPRPFRASLRHAGLMGAQLGACAAILLVTFHALGLPDVGWALVTMCIVLQPELTQSLTSAATLFVANAIGASCGVIAVYYLGHGPWQLVAGLVACVAACSLLRLDLGVRNGCAAVVIMWYFPREVDAVVLGAERVVAVLAGCAVAVGLQYAVARGVRLRRRLRAGRHAHAEVYAAEL